jgi:hypothetical protein
VSYGTPHLKRGWVCNLQFLLGVTSAMFLGSEFCRTHNQILRLKFETSPVWRARFLYLFPPRNRVYQIAEEAQSLKLCYNWQSVGQSVLMSGTHLGPIAIFFNYLYRQFRVCWWGVPSLTSGQICSLQSLLGPASTVIFGSKSLRTHDLILLSQIWDCPTWRNRVTQLYPQALDNGDSHWMLSSFYTLRRIE